MTNIGARKREVLIAKFDDMVTTGVITQGISLDAGWAYNHWDGQAWLDLLEEAESSLSEEDFEWFDEYASERLSEEDDGRASEYNEKNNPDAFR